MRDEATPDGAACTYQLEHCSSYVEVIKQRMEKATQVISNLYS